MSSLESLSKQFTEEQQAQQELMQARQKLETQYQENLSVQQEFDKIDDDETKIYKLVGPVLLPHDFTEAKLNVDKRLEFISNEIKRVEEQVVTKNKNLENLRNQIIQIRTAQTTAASTTAPVS